MAQRVRGLLCKLVSLRLIQFLAVSSEHHVCTCDFPEAFLPYTGAGIYLQLAGLVESTLLLSHLANP